MRSCFRPTAGCVGQSAIRNPQSAIRNALACALLLLLAATGRALAAPYQLAYTVAPMPPRNGGLASTHVKLDIGGVAEPSVQVQMAVWAPGDYRAVNFAQYVRAMEARATTAGGTAGGAPLTVMHPDPNTWEVRTGGAQDIEVEYDLPNEPAGFFSDNARVTPTFAFYNGPAVYVYVVGHKTDPAALHVALPEGWKQAIVPLDPAPSSATTESFRAPDFDTLADSPLVVGDYVTRTFTYAGRPHTLVFFDRHAGTDYDSFVPIYQKMVAEENRLMGGPPYARYDFFIDMGGRGGGLEHLNSHRIAWYGRTANPSIADFMGHEFYHLWNVKRIRPVVLGPFDYIHPPHTHNLWFCEGVTDYVAGLSALRAGMTDTAGYLQRIGGRITQLQRTPARLRVTADESSWRVWEANNSEGYGGLSYYLKGDLIGLCLDLKLRQVTGDRKSLDDVMRDMMARYGLPKPGYPEDGIRDAVIRAGGEEMGPFYDRLARSTEEMPFAECLRYAGLLLREEDGRYRVVEDPNAPPEAVALRQAWFAGRPAGG